MSSTRVTTTPSENWNADTAVLRAGDPPVQIAGREPFRSSLLVLNDADSTADVYLVPQLGRSVGGVRVKPGAGVSLNTIAPVFAYASGAAGLTATVYAVGESGSC